LKNVPAHGIAEKPAMKICVEMGDEELTCTRRRPDELLERMNARAAPLSVART
jgi:hypothetical protein